MLILYILFILILFLFIISLILYNNCKDRKSFSFKDKKLIQDIEPDEEYFEVNNYVNPSLLSEIYVDYKLKN